MTRFDPRIFEDPRRVGSKRFIQLGVCHNSLWQASAGADDKALHPYPRKSSVYRIPSNVGRTFQSRDLPPTESRRVSRRSDEAAQAVRHAPDPLRWELTFHQPPTAGPSCRRGLKIIESRENAMAMNKRE